MTNYVNRWIKKQLRLLRKARGNKCEMCGEKGRLQFAHVKPTGLSGRGRGRKERYYDVVKHPESYKLVCRKCHGGLDSNA